LLAANYAANRPDGSGAEWNWFGVAVHASDDRGRSWRCLAKLSEDDRVTGEPTLLRTRSGRVILLARTEILQGRDFTRRGMLMQSVSLDEGQTWSPLEETKMSSMSSPGHLLQLQDGRILASHASRFYPGSIYVTTSDDEGRTWNTDRTRIVACDLPNDDSCYPTSGQLADGTILTTWYGNLFGKFYIAVMRYRPEDL